MVFVPTTVVNARQFGRRWPISSRGPPRRLPARPTEASSRVRRRPACPFRPRDVEAVCREHVFASSPAATSPPLPPPPLQPRLGSLIPCRYPAGATAIARGFASFRKISGPPAVHRIHPQGYGKHRDPRDDDPLPSTTLIPTPSAASVARWFPNSSSMGATASRPSAPRRRKPFVTTSQARRPNLPRVAGSLPHEFSVPFLPFLWFETLRARLPAALPRALWPPAAPFFSASFPACLSSLTSLDKIQPGV